MNRLFLQQMMERSVEKLRHDTSKLVTIDPFGHKIRDRTLYSFDSASPPVRKPDFMAIGSDVDIGGYTTSHLTPVMNKSSSSSTSTLPPAENSPSAQSIQEKSKAGPSQSHLAFHGYMSLKVPQEYSGRIRTGYAGTRNRKRMTLLGEDTWDLGDYTHLRVTVAYRGWEGWRNRWYCNIQTDGPILTDLYQHRLFLPPNPASTLSTASLDPQKDPAPHFTSIYLPLKSFVLTNSGRTSERQLEMLYSRVRTVGFSLLGGGRDEHGINAAPRKYSEAQITELRRLASAGMGKGGGKEDPDMFVEDMLHRDGIVVKGSKASKADPVRASGYHRAPEVEEQIEAEEAEEGEGEKSYPALEYGQDETVKVNEWSEGYYELCIKSIEAVRHDPMADEGGAEAADM